MMAFLVQVLAWIGGAVLSLSLLFAAIGIVVRLRRRLPRQIILEVELDEEIVEHAPAAPLGKLMSPRVSTLADIIGAIDRAAKDPRVRAMVARIGTPHIGLAQIQEVRQAVARFRSAGKLAVAHADSFGEGGGGNATYYLATAFERIYLQPSGEVGLTGLRIDVPFVKRTLDKLGVKARLDHREAFKTAKNTFTEEGLTPEHRASLEALTGSILDELVAGVAEGRKLAAEQVRALFAEGPFFAAQARERGLVDRLAYRDEVYDELRAQVGKKAELLYLHKYFAKSGRGAGKGARLGLIYGVGTIRRGKHGFGFGERSPSMSAETVAAAVRAAVRDPKTKGILLRIDSPGGSPVASDTIWREVVEARAKGKPVVVSMSNYAASGGYFVSAPATAILAQPSTLTGSIGVFGGKLVAADLARRIGIDIEGVQTSANADLYSMHHDYTPEQWRHVQAWLDRIYDDFVGKVAEGRKLTREQVLAVAQGRVWTGREALEARLVDELGGMYEAVERLKKEAGVAPEAKVHLREFPARKSLWERWRGRGADNSEREGVQALASGALRALEPLARAVGLMPPLEVLEVPRLRGL